MWRLQPQGLGWSVLHRCQATVPVWVQRIPLSDMTREEINQLVQELGFYRKETPDAPVPEEFQFAPAKPLPILLPPQASTTDGKTPPKWDKEERPDL